MFICTIGYFWDSNGAEILQKSLSKPFGPFELILGIFATFSYLFNLLWIFLFFLYSPEGLTF
jgi:hypothetical protein